MWHLTTFFSIQEISTSYLHFWALKCQSKQLPWLKEINFHPSGADYATAIASSLVTGNFQHTDYWTIPIHDLFSFKNLKSIFT